MVPCWNPGLGRNTMSGEENSSVADNPPMSAQEKELTAESEKIMHKLLENLNSVAVSQPNTEMGVVAQTSSSTTSSDLSDDKNLPHSEKMYLQALAARREFDRKQRVLAESLKRRAVPKLSMKSRKIAASMDQTSRERLLQPAHRRKSEVAQPTFKPEINPKSNDLVQHDWKNAFSRLYAESQERRKRKEVLSSKNPREAEELAACTFKPKVRHYKNNHETLGGQTPKVETRLRDWEKRRQERIAVQQRVQQQAKLAPKYTFQPNVNKPRRRKSTTAQPMFKCSGVDKFLERQQKARLERDRVKDMQSHSTKRWANRVTVPKAPVLGTEVRSKRKNSGYVRADSILNYKPTVDVRSPPPPPRAPPPIPRESPTPPHSLEDSSRASTELENRETEEEELDNFALLRKLLQS